MQDNGPLLVVTLLLFAAGGAIVGHVLTDLLQPETLPYTEPHHEFLSNDDKDCVAWDFSTVNAHVIICEDEPPILVQKKQSKGLRLWDERVSEQVSEQVQL